MIASFERQKQNDLIKDETRKKQNQVSNQVKNSQPNENKQNETEDTKE